MNTKYKYLITVFLKLLKLESAVEQIFHLYD